MKKRRLWIASLVGALMLAGTVYFVYREITYVTTDNAQIGAHVVMLSSRVSGTIQQVLVEEHQKVKAGQVLAQIDISDYSNASDAAEAQVASLEARLKEAELNFNRASALFRKQAIPKERYDSALAAYKELGARIKAAQAERNVADLNVSYTKIVAPTDGTIARKSIERGQVVPQGQPLFGFVSSDERWVTANLKETELPQVKLGAKADVTVDALPGRRFDGTVESVSPSTGSVFSLLPPDNSTGNFTKVVQRVPVRIRLAHLSEKEIESLQAGLSAVVSIRIR